MSVGLPRKSTIRAAGLRPQAGEWYERIGAVHPDRRGLHRLAIASSTGARPIADVVAIVPADPDEEAARALADGALAQPWARLHGSVQHSLESLWEQIRRQSPGRLSRSGLVSTPKLPMFSYRVFYRRAFDEEDPIVVGVEAWPEADGYQVLGEICGEDSGQSYFGELIGSSPDDVDLQRTVEEVVAKLGGQVGAVIAALDEA